MRLGLSQIRDGSIQGSLNVGLDRSVDGWDLHKRDIRHCREEEEGKFCYQKIIKYAQETF